MPELPEVEHFRTLLLPLVSSEHTITLERCNLDKKPPRKFMSDEEIDEINHGKFYLSDVKRKGKAIAMILTKNQKKKEPTRKFVMVHMGMTGRISTPEHVPDLESLTASEYPPPHTYLKFSSSDGTSEACFSDPRKFGAIQISSSLEEIFGSLAPDAWTDVNEAEAFDAILDKVSGQSIGIKALLLDQKRAICGVGNWVADEVLYQTQIHPDQTYLNREQATHLLKSLREILDTAVNCLVQKKEKFPKDWLFHYRWNSKKETKDYAGRVVTFLTSGGRTSAVVPSLQKKKGQKPQQSKKRPDSPSKKGTKAKKVKRENSATSSKNPKQKHNAASTADKLVSSKSTMNEEDIKTGRRRSNRLRN